MLGRYRARSESLLTYALRRLLPSLCVALLMAAPSAHAAGPVTPEVEVMGATTLRGETAGAYGPVVVADPSSPNELLATATSSSGRTAFVVRSSDGGTSWGSPANSPEYLSEGSGPAPLSAG